MDSSASTPAPELDAVGTNLLPFTAHWTDFINTILEDGDRVPLSVCDAFVADDDCLLKSKMHLQQCLDSSQTSTHRQTHIRSLIAIVLNPHDCVVDKKAFPVTDPDPYITSARSVSQRALSLLTAALHTNPLGVLRALPGYDPCTKTEAGEPGDPSYRHVHILVPSKASTSAHPSSSGAKRMSSGKAKKRKSRASDVSVAMQEAESDSDDDAPVQIAGRRIGQAENIWSLLGGNATKKRRSSQPFSEQPDQISTAGWYLLETLIEGWESDGLRKGKAAESEPSLDVIPWSPQLLRQFEFVGSGLPRKHTAAILDLLLRVFREREDTQAVLKAEMPIYRKRKLCGRLLGLLIDLATAGRLSLSALQMDLAERMHEMDADVFRSFLLHFPLGRLPFKMNLHRHYLESYSAHLPSPQNSMFTGPRPAPPSPRKLGSQDSSSASIAHSSPVKASSTTIAPQQIVDTLFNRVPTELANDMLDLQPKKSAYIKHEVIKLDLLRSLIGRQDVVCQDWVQLARDGTLQSSLDTARSRMPDSEMKKWLAESGDAIVQSLVDRREGRSASQASTDVETQPAAN